MARITIYAGTDRERTVELTDETSIGRASGNAIQLPDAQISRHHARIETRSGRHFLINLGARNGLFLNGTAIEEAELADGDRITIADIELRFTGEPPEDLPEEDEDTGTPSVILTDTSSGSISTAGFVQTVNSLIGPPAANDRALVAAHRRLAAVHEIGLAISSVRELDSLRERIASVVLDTLNAERCVILHYDEQDEQLIPVTARSLRKGKRRRGKPDEIQIPRAILELVFDQSQAIVSNDVLGDERFEGSRSLQISQIASVVASPLERPGRKLGAIYVDTLDHTRLFEDEDLQLLTTIAAVATIALENAQVFAATTAENRRLRDALRSSIDLVGESESIEKVIDTIAKVAPTETTILIRGETGTGKELVAQAIHDASPRRDAPFIAVNCAALSESLLSSELFGHEKGAFTGAHERKQGKFEIADGGTLFLDEVGEVSPAMQAKLLRVLQERTFERVGGVEPIGVDVRILAATNRDLEEAIQEGTFRQDLYFRLRVFEIALPPLRDRRGDLPLLVGHFLDRFSRRTGKRVRGVSPEAMQVLSGYPWPGNVRELQNVIERAVVLCDGELLDADDLPGELRESKFFAEVSDRIEELDLALPDVIRWVEKTCIERAIKRTRKKVELARILGISRPTLDKKLRDYQLKL